MGAMLFLSRPLQAPEKAIFTAEYFRSGKHTQNIFLYRLILKPFTIAALVQLVHQMLQEMAGPTQ